MTITRKIGAALGVVLALLFLYTGWLALTSQELVLPTNGVIGAAGVDDPAEGATGAATLQARTQLQRWRGDTGPSPASPVPPAETMSGEGPPGTPPESADVADPLGRALVGDWLAARRSQEEILQEPRRIEGATSLPEEVRAVFEQPQGRLWRATHNGLIVFGGALYMVGVLALLFIFLAFRGRVRVKEGFSGERLPRFGPLERANHWMTAAAFSLMALTGLVVLYGRSLIRPWLGADIFDDLAEASVWLHMALLLPFALGLATMIALWTLQNLPRKVDWIWLKQGGGIIGDKNPPAERFNAGQKMIFWSVVLGGLALIVTGLGLMFPFAWSGYTGMQLAQSLHAIIALVMIGIIFGHIYIGTVGMEGAFEAMWDGWVDRNWAREHHSIWYRRLVGGNGDRRHPAE